ncbi:MAG: HPr family phosphocarrier protein [Clostridiales bacterium]|jgi:phosphotransferase system HPr (HPr) family protein|nr:HPr family phosphocarrier protein [Clostridiales bacterium]
MTQRSIQVLASLDARPAALFVQTASQFASSIHLVIDNKRINAKSIMGVISLGVLDGQNVTIQADGKDEEQALDKLEKFLNAD